jgi:hypothetical protein
LVPRAQTSRSIRPIRPAPRVFVQPQRRVIVQRPPVYYSRSPFFSPAPVITTPIITTPVYSEPAVTHDTDDLVREIERLTLEVQQLRDEQALRYAAPIVPDTSQSAEPPPPATPTVLVFRDGHRLEIQNWVIAGQTLWSFDDHSSTKIAISDLDLEATQKVNRERGVRFPLSGR